MSYLPIAKLVPQYVDSNGDTYSGAVLKAYADGTSTNISMATDTTGGTTFTSCVLNSNGFPEVSGSIIIPHVDQAYKLVLYPDQTSADANSGAIWTIDNIPIIDFSTYFTATETGTGDAYAITITGITSYEAGVRVQFIASEANVGACTVNINSLGATSIKLLDGGDPYDNAILANALVDLFYDGTNFQLLNPSSIQINDANGNEVIKTATTASAVNEITVTNAATGNGPTISATGDDTNIDINLTPKGTGNVLNTKAVSGYVSGVTEYIESDTGADSTLFDVDLNISTAWESIGPTGSGADNIWTAMDNIPSGAKYVKLRIYNLIGGSTSGTNYTNTLYSRVTGSSTAIDVSNIISIGNIDNGTGATQESLSFHIANVPLDSSNRFDLYHSTSGSPSVLNVRIFVAGWGI